MTTPTRPTGSRQPIVFPIGRYTGAFHPSAGAPAKYHSLRIGRLSVTLRTEQTLAVWAAAHRPPDQPDRPWTRTAVEDAARRRLAVHDPVEIMAELFQTGLLVEITPGTGDAVGFARTHRVIPLLLPLGNTPEEPLLNGTGLFGLDPVVRVTALVHDMLHWGRHSASLWQVCEATATAGAESGVTEPREIEPEHLLATFLESLQLLLGPNAAYIDEARHS